MKSVLRTFVLGVFAGMLIAIGGASNMQLSSMDQPIFGAIFFSFGLMCVCVLGANLFTGKVGYVLENDKHYALDIVIMMIGNILGAMAVGLLAAAIFPNWTMSLGPKILYGEGASWYGCILRALGAGAFVYLAVEGYKKVPSFPAKLILVCLSIATMVLLGCNHSIANVFYFAYAGAKGLPGFDGLNAVVSIVIACVGNALGSLILYLLQRGFAFLSKPKVQ